MRATRRTVWVALSEHSLQNSAGAPPSGCDQRRSTDGDLLVLHLSGPSYKVKVRLVASKRGPRAGKAHTRQGQRRTSRMEKARPHGYICGGVERRPAGQVVGEEPCSGLQSLTWCMDSSSAAVELGGIQRHGVTCENRSL
jgi:hypothetical protein